MKSAVFFFTFHCKPVFVMLLCQYFCRGPKKQLKTSAGPWDLVCIVDELDLGPAGFGANLGPFTMHFHPLVQACALN